MSARAGTTRFLSAVMSVALVAATGTGTIKDRVSDAATGAPVAQARVRIRTGPWGPANLSDVFAGQNVGVTQVSDRVWLVTFMHNDLGYFDDEAIRLEPIENPFAPKVLPMCSEQSVTHVTG